jgi:hypothetical protein
VSTGKAASRELVVVGTANVVTEAVVVNMTTAGRIVPVLVEIVTLALVNVDAAVELIEYVHGDKVVGFTIADDGPSTTEKTG